MATRKTSARRSSAEKAADAVGDQLARYQSMRDFGITSEPSGKSGTKKITAKRLKSVAALPFVIQKHAASHLHYDFRLGWNGVLKSWACAKGPSYYPGDRRLAVQVEDHPIEYGGFEGIIPKGQYGGGTVMVWDQGTWEPQPGHEDVDDGLRKGSLKFTMHGTKIMGNWTLVRMTGKAARESKPNWLLIKEHDKFERSEGDKPITEEKPNSVVTGRDLDQIAASEDHVWNSKETATSTKPWQRSASKAVAAKSASPSGTAAKAKPVMPPFAAELKQAPKETLPAFVAPQLAQSAETATTSTGWLHELKLDGYRIQARKNGSRVQLLTRSSLDWTHRMSALTAQVARLPVKNALLDGEVVVLSDNGTTSFAELQAAFQENKPAKLTYFAFDLLHLDGHNLRGLPLLKRKSLLSKLLGDPPENIRITEHVEGPGETVFHKACELHAEGIISKRAGGRYISGRNNDWLKLKCIHEQEFVIGGYTLPSNGSRGIGALLLGYYDESGAFVYAGRTGTGFTQKAHRSLRDKLDKLQVQKSAFVAMPVEAKRGARWVKPKLVAQVHFATWTAENLVRQAAFQGLREDKLAKDVRRELPQPVPKRKASRASASQPVQGKGMKAALVAPAQLKRAKASASKTETAAVRLTHPDKVLDTESGLTKQQLADYYWAVSAHMLPHVADRPLSLVRCPEGSTKPCFYQKHVSAQLPPGIKSVEVVDKKSGKPEPYITLDSAEALAGLAQMGVLEVHPWGSRNDDLEHPDRIVIDLDPDEALEWKVLADAAVEVRVQLKSLGLESFLKSTGGKGLHVVVPVLPTNSWDSVKKFAHQFVLAMEQGNPKLYLTKMTKAARKGRIYLDYLRNERGATSVAAFSPRARKGAPVSVPLSWIELKAKERPVFAVADFGNWKGRLKKDPWEKMGSLKQKLNLAK